MVQGGCMRKRITMTERAWLVFSLGVAGFASPVWGWILHLGVWWVPYLMAGLLVLGVYWVQQGDD